MKQPSGRARTPRLQAGREEGAPVPHREEAGFGGPGNGEEAGVAAGTGKWSPPGGENSFESHINWRYLINSSF